MLRSAIARNTHRCYTYRYTVLKNWHPATFHAKNVSIMSSPSLKESVAAIIANRGFCWESFVFEKVQFDSNSISFAEEWGKFAFLVTKIASSVTSEQANNYQLPRTYGKRILKMSFRMHPIFMLRKHRLKMVCSMHFEIHCTILFSPLRLMEATEI